MNIPKHLVGIVRLNVAGELKIGKPKKSAPILGSFSKATKGSVSINFDVSGGKSCDAGCTLKNTLCYAEIVERRPDRVQLASKLERHGKLPAAQVCGAALIELQALEAKGKVIPWVRISSAGSVPQIEDVTALFISQMRTLLTWCKSRSIPVHFPVETIAKADFYRALFGDLVTVRASLQTDAEFLTYRAAASYVVGRDITEGKAIRARRIEAARTMARERYLATGRKTIVCPAITSDWMRRSARINAKKNGTDAGRFADKIKCGKFGCNACENPLIDVIYPQH